MYQSYNNLMLYTKNVTYTDMSSYLLKSLTIYMSDTEFDVLHNLRSCAVCQSLCVFRYRRSTDVRRNIGRKIHNSNYIITTE